MNDSDPLITRPFIHIKPRKGWQVIDFSDLKEYRDLLYFLVLRDIKVKYKQTVLGGLWAVIQPFCSMVLFSLFFGTLAKMPSDGVPYPVFSYSALVAWTYFAHALSGSGTSLIANTSLISKVYFPRLIIPFSPVLAGLLDFGIAFLVLIGMMLYFGILPNCFCGISASFGNSHDYGGQRRRHDPRRSQCQVQGYWIYHSFPGAVVDVCLSCGIPCLDGAGEIPPPVRDQSHVWNHRRISFGPSGNDSVSNNVDSGFCYNEHGSFLCRSFLFQTSGTVFCRYPVTARSAKRFSSNACFYCGIVISVHSINFTGAF